MDENIKSTDEKMEIDYKELNKQNKEAILGSEKYAKLEVIVGEDNPMPFMNLEIRNASTVVVAALYVLLSKEQEIMREEFPELVYALPFVDAKTIKDYKEDSGDDEGES